MYDTLDPRLERVDETSLLLLYFVFIFLFIFHAVLNTPSCNSKTAVTSTQRVTRTSDPRTKKRAPYLLG